MMAAMGRAIAVRWSEIHRRVVPSAVLLPQRLLAGRIRTRIYKALAGPMGR